MSLINEMNNLVNNLEVYESEEFGQIRTIAVNEEPWFVANDIARALGYTNPSKATNDHCKKSKMIWGNDSLGRRQQFKVIPEGDIYRLIISSKLPSAEKFESWVFDEVLPQIRKTGGYIPHDEGEDDETIMAKALVVAQKTIDNKNKLLEDAKKEIAEKDRVITQISISQNTKLVRETAKAISKSNSKILIGERRLYERLRSWGWVCKNSTEATQYAVERGYLEVSEGTKKTARGTFTFRTTRVTGKGEIKIIEKLLKEKDLEKLLEENEKSK